jgi:hypothetical protein
MKILITILLFFVFPFQSEKVFICDSNFATKYHLRNDCKGLNNCSKKVIEIELSKVQERELCKLCKFSKK